MNKYLELLIVFIGKAISHRVSMGFTWTPLAIDVSTNSLELKWAIHYRYKTLRFSSDIEPGEADYVLDKIENFIISIDSPTEQES